MHKLKILSGILAVQIALVIASSYLGGQDLSLYTSDENILSMNVADVNAISITDADSNELHLKKTEKAGWEIQEADNFTADQSKVENFITKVTSLKKTWPVGQSKAALKPLKVADQDFERRFVFSSKAKDLATLYLGTSPGFKKVHARTGADSTVYSVELSAFELPATPDAWTDKEFLYLPKEQIEVVNLPKVRLKKQEKGILPVDLEENEEVNKVEVNSLLTQVVMMKYMDLIGITAPDTYSELQETVEFDVKLKNQEKPLQYTAKGPYEESFYVLKRSDVPYYFKISKGIADRIAQASRDSLVSVKKEQTPVDTQKEAQ